MRSFGYHSGSVRLNDFENKIIVSLIQQYEILFILTGTCMWSGRREFLSEGHGTAKRESAVANRTKPRPAICTVMR